ncbi:MAG: hypothetical protein HY904_23335 [Deltaproteobacteria bacterium]|nr:hypothetical protein [Deltaproteobacteria bacterium]
MRMSGMTVAGTILVLALSGCGGGKGAQRGAAKGSAAVRAARVDMEQGGFSRATVHVVLVVDNQTNKALTIQGAEIETSFAGGGADGEGDAPSDGQTFKGAMQPSGRASVDPGGTAEIPVEVELVYPSEPGAFMAFTKPSVQRLKVVGTVQSSAGALPINDETDFPTPKLLQGQVKEAQMSSVDDGAAGEVTLELVLFNPNPFPVKADVWNMKITVADKDLKEVDVGQAETVLPNAGVAYSESFKIDQENWGPDYKQVLKRSAVSWKVVGSIKVGDVTYPSEASGEMKFHR